MSTFVLPQTTVIPMGCPRCHQDLAYDVEGQRYTCRCGYSRPSINVDPRDLVVASPNGDQVENPEIVPIPALAQEWGVDASTVLRHLRLARVPFLTSSGQPTSGGYGVRLHVRRSDADRVRARPPLRTRNRAPGGRQGAAETVSASAAVVAAVPISPAILPAPPAPVARPKSPRAIARPATAARPGRLRLALEHIARLTEAAVESQVIVAIDALVGYALAVDDAEGGAP